MTDSTIPPQGGDKSETLKRLEEEERQVVETLRGAAQRNRAEQERLARESSQVNTERLRNEQERDELRREKEALKKTNDAMIDTEILARKRRIETLKAILAYLTVLAVVVVGGFFAYRYLPAPSETASTGVSERRIADIAGATFDQRIKPLTNDVERLQVDSKALKNGFTDLSEEVKKTRTDVTAGLKDVLDRLNKAPAAPPAAAVPPVASADPVETRRLAQVQAECLPEAATGVNFKESLGEESFQAYLRQCRAVKEHTTRQADVPAVSAPQQQAVDDSVAGEEESTSTAAVAEGTEDETLTGSYDQRTANAMSPSLVAQAGFREGPHLGPPGFARPPYGAPHAGHRHGAPRGAARCPPGMHMTPLGLCGGPRVMATPDIKARYNVPPEVARCVPGTVREQKVPLPGGGVRVLHQTCRR